LSDNKHDITEILEYIDPSLLDYQEWVSVGMALKDDGKTAFDWDQWSQKDSNRYHPGECFKKWDSFRGTAKPVTVGSIVQMAKDQGWLPKSEYFNNNESKELDWDDIIGAKDEMVIVDRNWLEGKDIEEPSDWDPVGQLVKYLEILFEASENVGYVTDSWEKEGKYLPTKGAWDRTAGELIQLLNNCKGDIGSVMGDYKEEAGAWIRFNPLDGKGVKNDNVTDFRYALVESDDMPVDQQNAIYRELELPIACLVHSGGKSLHAIVRIDAGNYDEYRKRVDYLYTICKKNGLKVDNQNRNPSRLSRMPGIMRKGQKQFLADTNIGKESWKEWQEWIESINDDLPEPVCLTDSLKNKPDLAPTLIDGILRQGHKMLLAGPSKAGKSFALIELCCAIAEGKEWLNWQCAQGKVLYVNLELDEASCIHRFDDVYKTLDYQLKNTDNIDIWNLRGKSVPMDKLAPKLIRRAAKKNYIAIIIDPIYKVITGDENSADQMATFCNQFDKVCTELGSAVIYCHHHSKGGQGNKKSMDRASGSGVFARDPDALLDLIELDLSESLLKQEENKAICKVCDTWLKKYINNYDEEVSRDDLCSSKLMLELSIKQLKPDVYKVMEKEIEAVKKYTQQRTAWRIEGTLREFPKFPPVNIWFDYPVHNVDEDEVLKDADAEGEKAPWKKASDKRKPKETNAKNRKIALENAINSCNFGEPPTVKLLSEAMGIQERTIRDRVKEHGGYEINNNIVTKKNIAENEKSSATAK